MGESLLTKSISRRSLGDILSSWLLEYSSIWLVICTGLALSIITFWITQHQLGIHRQLDFQWAGHNRFRSLQREIDKELSALHEMQRLLSSFDKLSAKHFRVSAQATLARSPSIQTLAWVSRTPKTENHFPILFVEPSANNQPLIGMDLATIAHFATLMELAQNQGRLMASQRISGFGSPSKKENLVALFLPIFQSMDDNHTSEERRKHLSGFIVGVLQVNHLASAAFGHLEPRGIDIWIHDDTTANNEESLLYHYASRLGAPQTLGTEDYLHTLETLNVADRSWRFHAVATPYFRSAQAFNEGPQIIFLEGLLFTTVLALYLFRLKRDIRVRGEMQESIQESEGRFRTLFEHVPDTIVMLDQQSRILFMNRPPPHPEQTELGLENYLDLLPKPQRKSHKQALERVFQKGLVEHLNHTLSDFTWWEVRLIPIKINQSVTSAMAIITDVTQNRILQAQAIRSARLASLGVLAASVAHEVNNPNSAIQFNASILYRTFGDIFPLLERASHTQPDLSLGGMPITESVEILPKLLSGITKSSQRIKKIVDTLKHMARQDEGTLNQSVSLHDIIKAALSILQNQIKNSTTNCQLNLPESLPLLQGNAQQLEQVFINLILNALQSLPNRDHGVTISAFIDSNQEHLIIEVKDEGSGIDPEQLKQIIEPFFTTRSASGGTGLGLSISTQIIHNHGGFLTFQSWVGKGTLATVKLPLSPSAMDGLTL